MLKNIDKSVVLSLESQLDYHDGQVVSKTLTQNENVGLTLFSFAKGEAISTHKSSGDAMVNILDGTAKITINDVDFVLSKGESIVMPAGEPHALFAIEQFKMLLTVVFPSDVAQ